MAGVLRSVDDWKARFEELVRGYNESNGTYLRVVVNDKPSLIRLIEKGACRSSVATVYAKDHAEVAVLEEKSILGLCRRKTVCALEYPYTSWSVLTSDKKYAPLGALMEEDVRKAERSLLSMP